MEASMELDKEIIECFTAVGYELHIYNQEGKYPCELDRDDWKKQEIVKCLRDHDPDAWRV